MTGHVVVVGSANLDLVVPVQAHPRPGETVLGGTLRRNPGGKGANQAVSAARTGRARTTFVGVVGRDEHGDILQRSLAGAGVDTSLLRRSERATGTALITVADDGENSIVVAPGANDDVSADDPEVAGRISEADVLLAQLEVPLDAVLDAAQALPPGAKFVLNAAPSRALPESVWGYVDVLVVNEHEAITLAASGKDATGAAAILATRADAVVLTLGGRGCVIVQDGEEPVVVPAPRVTAVDTTGAGDAFCGVLAASLAGGASLVDAAARAVAAGALAVTREGALDAAAGAEELDEFVTTHQPEDE